MSDYSGDSDGGDEQLQRPRTPSDSRAGPEYNAEISYAGPMSQSSSRAPGTPRRSIFARSNSVRYLDFPRLNSSYAEPTKVATPVAPKPAAPKPEEPVTYPKPGYVPSDVPASAFHAVTHWHKTRRAHNTYLWFDLAPAEGRMRGINVIIRFYVDDETHPKGTRGYTNRPETPIDTLATGHYGRFALESLTQFFYGIGEHARYLYDVPHARAMQLHYEDWVRADVRLLLLELGGPTETALFAALLQQWIALCRMRFVEREVGHWTRTWTDTKVRRVLEHGSMINVYDGSGKQTVWMLFDQAGIRICQPENSIRIEDITNLTFTKPEDDKELNDEEVAAAAALSQALAKTGGTAVDAADKNGIPSALDSAPGSLALIEASKHVRTQGFTVTIKTVSNETGVMGEFKLVAMSEPSILEWLFRLKMEVQKYTTAAAETTAANNSAATPHAGESAQQHWWSAFEHEESDRQLKACNVLLDDEDMVLVGPPRPIDPPEVARFKRARWALSEETRLALTALSRGALMRLHSTNAPPALLVFVVRQGRLAWLSPVDTNAPLTNENSIALETVTKIMLGKQTSTFTFMESGKSVAPEHCCSIVFAPMAAVEPPSTASAAHLQRIALLALSKSLAAGELCLEAESESAMLTFLTHLKVLTDEPDLVTAGFRVAKTALNDDARSMLSHLYAGTELIWSSGMVYPVQPGAPIPEGAVLSEDRLHYSIEHAPHVRRVLFRSGRLYFCAQDHLVSLSALRALCHGLHPPFQNAIGLKQIPPAHSWSILYDANHNHVVISQGLAGIETLSPVTDYSNIGTAAATQGISAFSGCTSFNVEFASRETFINWHEGFKVLLADCGMAVSHCVGALDRKTGPIYLCLPRRQQSLRESANNGVRFLTHSSSSTGAGAGAASNGGGSAIAPPTKSVLYSTQQALLWGQLGECLSLRHIKDVWAGAAPTAISESQSRQEISTEHIELRKVNKALGRKSGAAALALAEAEAAARTLPGDSKRVRRQRLKDALAANRMLDVSDRLSLLVEEQCIADGKLTARNKVLRFYAVPGVKSEEERELEKDSKAASSAAALTETLAKAKAEAGGVNVTALTDVNKAGGRARAGSESDNDGDGDDDDDEFDGGATAAFFARNSAVSGVKTRTLRSSINSAHPSAALTNGSHLGGWVLALYDSAFTAHAAAQAATRDISRIKFRMGAKWHKYQDIDEFAPLFQGVVMSLHRGDGPAEPRLVYFSQGRVCVEAPEATTREANLNSFSVDGMDLMLGKQSTVFLRTTWGAAARDICCFTLLMRDDMMNETEINLEMGSPAHLQHYVDCIERFMKAEGARVVRSEEPSAFPEAPPARFISFVPESSKLTSRGATRQRLMRLTTGGAPFLMFDSPNSPPQEVLLFVRNNTLVWVPKQNRISIGSLQCVTLTKTGSMARNPYAASADAFECAVIGFEDQTAADRVGELHLESPGHITKLHAWFLGLHLGLERAGVIVSPEQHSSGGLLGFRQWTIAPPVESHTAISGPGEVLTAVPSNEKLRMFVDCSRAFFCGAEVGRQSISARTLHFRDLISIHVGAAASAFDVPLMERHNIRMLRVATLEAQGGDTEGGADTSPAAVLANASRKVLQNSSLIDHSMLDVRAFSLQFLDPMYRAVTVGFLASSHAQLTRVIDLILAQVRSLGFQVAEPPGVRLPGTRISIWSPKRVHLHRDLAPSAAALGAPLLNSPAQYLRALLAAPLRELFRGRTFTGIAIGRDVHLLKAPVCLFYDGQDRAANAARGARLNDGTLAAAAQGAYDEDDDWCVSGSALTHGKIYWCPVGRREQVPGCAISLRDITHVYVGKQTPAFVSPQAIDLDPACCFSLATATDTVDLCAPNPYVRHAWLNALVLAMNASSLAYGLRTPGAPTLLLSPTPATPHALHPAALSLQSRLLRDVLGTEANTYDPEFIDDPSSEQAAIHPTAELSAVVRASATHVLSTAVAEPLAGAHAVSISAALSRALSTADDEAVLTKGINAVAVDCVFAPTERQLSDAAAAGRDLSSAYGFAGTHDVYEVVEARRATSESVQIFFLPDVSSGVNTALYAPTGAIEMTGSDASDAGGDWGGALYWCRSGMPRRCLPGQCVPICALTEIRVTGQGTISLASPVLRGRVFRGVLRLTTQDTKAMSEFSRAVAARWRRVPAAVKARAVSLAQLGTMPRYAAEAAALAYSLARGFPGSATAFSAVRPEDVHGGRGASALVKAAAAAAGGGADNKGLEALQLDLIDDDRGDTGAADADVLPLGAASQEQHDAAAASAEAGSVFAVAALDGVPAAHALLPAASSGSGSGASARGPSGGPTALHAMLSGLFTPEFPFGPPLGEVAAAVPGLEDDNSADTGADAALAAALEREARARWDAAQTALESQRADMLADRLRREKEAALVAAEAEPLSEEDEDEYEWVAEDEAYYAEEDVEEEEEEDEDEEDIWVQIARRAEAAKRRVHERARQQLADVVDAAARGQIVPITLPGSAAAKPEAAAETPAGTAGAPAAGPATAPHYAKSSAAPSATVSAAASAAASDDEEGGVIDEGDADADAAAVTDVANAAAAPERAASPGAAEPSTVSMSRAARRDAASATRVPDVTVDENAAAIVVPQTVYRDAWQIGLQEAEEEERALEKMLAKARKARLQAQKRLVVMQQAQQAQKKAADEATARAAAEAAAARAAAAALEPSEDAIEGDDDADDEDEDSDVDDDEEEEHEHHSTAL